MKQTYIFAAPGEILSYILKLSIYNVGAEGNVAFAFAVLVVLQCGSPIQGVNVNTPEQELKSIESTATSIETTLDKNLERATPNENAALTKIQAMTSSYSHPSNAWRNYEVMLSSEIEWTQHKLRASLCNQYYQFKKFIAERPPVDATLREWINSAEYKSKTVFPHLEAEIIAPLLKNKHNRQTVFYQSRS
ncbi:uncharacterized protein [Bemisia tabaci]|uniref:uncharacterized protein isoform X2 n=1 Tax=Bemisia tabaci TaxID=7038 RepID=UPI003B28AA2F